MGGASTVQVFAAIDGRSGKPLWEAEFYARVMQRPSGV